MKSHRFTNTAALGLTLIAFAAPPASANIRDEAVVGASQPANAGKIHQETVVQSPQTTSAVSQIRDETVAVRPQPAPIRDETIVASPQASPASSSSRSASGVDWADVGIGGGGVLALILLGAGGAYAIAHHRRGRPDRMRNLTATGADGR